MNMAQMRFLHILLLLGRDGWWAIGQRQTQKYDDNNGLMMIMLMVMVVIMAMLKMVLIMMWRRIFLVVFVPLTGVENADGNDDGGRTCFAHT